MRALISVYDKTGLVEFVEKLVEHGFEIVASGGTASILENNGITVKEVSQLTAYPEMLGGRVKTLHPAVHAGILAPRDSRSLGEIAKHHIAPIDMVVVNLYPFAEVVSKPDVKLEDAVENIDIGGSALLRGAAKNFENVTVVCDPADYPMVTKEIEAEGNTSLATRKRLALKTFQRTAAYDARIAAYLGELLQAPLISDTFPQRQLLMLEKALDLRYGENPHQRAAAYQLPGEPGVLRARQLHGKELSYNNILDLDAAWMTAFEFNQPAAVIVKHTNPCGVSVARSLVDAYKSALSGDPLSAYGGIVALNRVVDLTTAMAINEIFTECVIAPGYENDSLAQLRQKKNLRVLALDKFGIPAIRLAGITGGVLIQDPDLDDPSNWDSVSKRPPTHHEMETLRFAWQVVKHVKSNAIVLAKDTSLTAMVTVGVGAGQMSRVDAVRIAIEKAGDRARGAVMASDAFFPFADGVELALAAGVTAIVQPGGSVRDQEIIAAVDSANAAMVITGVRHFRH